MMKTSHFLIIGGILLVIVGICWWYLQERKTFEGDITRLYFSEGDGGRSYGYHYTLKKQKDEKILLQYEQSFPEEETKEKELTEAQLQELTKKVNTSEVLSWDGFNKDNTNVLDGSSRSLDITYENGDEMRAHGYERYPRNFYEQKSIIVSALLSLLDEDAEIAEE